MKKLTFLLAILLISLFTCSNTVVDSKTFHNIEIQKAHKDISILLTGDFSIIKEINALNNENKNNVLVLALNIFHEARGECLEGQVAVTNVVFNRVKSKHYPNTIIEVVYQSKQFSWTLKNDRISEIKKEIDSWIKCQQLAFIVYTSHKKDLISQQYLHYVNKNIVDRIEWTKSFSKRKIIGQHVFLTKGEINA